MIRIIGVDPVIEGQFQKCSVHWLEGRQAYVVIVYVRTATQARIAREIGAIKPIKGNGKDWPERCVWARTQAIEAQQAVIQAARGSRLSGSVVVLEWNNGALITV